MRFKRRKIECPPPFIAMADIAFNLVLFFVILARIQNDPKKDWDPATAPNLVQVKNSLVTVTVDRDNRIYLNGHEVGLRDLGDMVAMQLGNNPPEKRTVLLKIHKATLASTFEPIMEAVSSAGGDVVHVLEEER